MSDWLSDLTSDESQKVDADQFRVNQQKAIPKDEPTFFQGTPKALFTGAGAGFAKAADTITAPITEVIDRTSHSFRDVRTEGFIEPYAEYKKSKDQARDELTMQAIDYLEDKENTGAAGRFVFGLTDYGTRAIVGSLGGGVIGATTVTGASEYDFVKKDLIRKGVDESTATKVAATQSVVAGVSTALPLSYGFRGTSGLITDGIASIGGATAFSTGGQYASNQMLESGGYVDQAKQYEVTKESIALDLALNSLFFAGGRYASRLDSQVDAELADIEANTTAKEAVLTFNDLDADAISSPVKSNNPIQINNHLKNLSDATDQLKSGRPVNIANTVKGEDRKAEAAVDIQTLNIPDNAKTIAREAQKVGVDPSAAVIISHIETGGRFNSDAKNPTSSAHGVFQVLDGYWNKVGGGDRNNLNNQIRVGLQHIKETNSQMEKSIGRSLEPHEQYLGHLLGGRGASRILKADPNAKLIDVVRQYDKGRANAIVNNNGMTGLTVGQAINKWKGKWNNLAARYGNLESSRSVSYSADGMPIDVSYSVRDISELTYKPDRIQLNEDVTSDSINFSETVKNFGRADTLDTGAPIVRQDGQIESGSYRSDLITQAYQSGNAVEYRAMVQKEADAMGINISDIPNPVLVRTPLENQDLSGFINQQTGLNTSPLVRNVEQPRKRLVDYDYESSAQAFKSELPTIPKDIESVPRQASAVDGVEIARFNNSKGESIAVAVKDGKVVAQSRTTDNGVEYSSSDSNIDAALRPEMESAVVPSESQNVASIDRSTGFGSTPEEQIALDIANQNPDQVISIQRENPNGEIEEITITMGELIQRIDADNQKAKGDIIATEAAINCAIRFGEA